MDASTVDATSNGDSPDKATPPLVLRRRRLVAVVAIAVSVAVLGVLSPIWIKSPQEIAAEARAPASTVLTAPVERRVLRDTVVLRADVQYLKTFAVTPGTHGDGKAVVTAVKVKQGDEISPGVVVVEVSGRPLFVLAGSIPAYRDLKPGESGKDIAQLQGALTALGFPPRAHDGFFGTGTKRALTAFYASRGYIPLPVSDTDAKQLADAQEQVTIAERQVADAEEALAAADADPTTTEAQRADAQKAVTRAKEDLATARDQLAEVKRTTGPMLPQSEYVFLPSFPARVEALSATIGTEVTTPLVTFATGRLAIKATLTEAQRTLCKQGQTVVIDGDLGLKATGTIDSIGALTSPNSGDKAGGSQQPPGYPMVVEPTHDLASRFAGLNVRLTIEVASSATPELAVPVSAIYGGADGSVYVTKRSADGAQTRIEVQPGMSAQGYVAVTVLSGQLGPGDLVIVGTP